MYIIMHKGRKYTLNLDYVPPVNPCSQCHHFSQAWEEITGYEGYDTTVQKGCHIDQYTKCYKKGAKSLWEAREEF